MGLQSDIGKTTVRERQEIATPYSKAAIILGTPKMLIARLMS